MAVLHPALVDSLAADREGFNARFEKRCHAGAQLDPQAFLTHLSTTVSPLIAAVHAVRPERVRGAVVALYDISLDLFSASLLGSEAKLPWLERLWREVLPAAAKQLAWEPQRVAGSLSNAMFQIASQPGTRPNQWLSLMTELASQCDSVDQLLDAGKIAAWQSGMVQYRSAALQTARHMPRPAVLKAMHLPDTMSAEELESALKQMLVDPWWTCGSRLQTSRSDSPLKLVASIGAFRGFGGPFVQPPNVHCHEGRWLVSDSRSTWVMLADAYGAMFQRTDEEFPRKKSEKSKPIQAKDDLKIEADGTIRWGQQTTHFAHLASATSCASDATTLGVTIATSHHVFLLSRTGAGT